MPDAVEPWTSLWTGANGVVIAAFLLVFPALLFTFWARGRFQEALTYFLQVPSSAGLTGFEVARRLLEDTAVRGVRIVPGTGARMRNHYHPFTREITLADTIYTSASLSALSIAAHEVGHAVQHARAYWLAWLRTALVPVARVCFVLGLLTTGFGVLGFRGGLVPVGVSLLGVCVLFYLVTLGIERDASARASALAARGGLLCPDEVPSVERVLRAASLTYVANVVQSACALIGLALLAFTLAQGPEGAVGETPAEVSFGLTALIQVAAVIVLFARRRTRGPRRDGLRAVELNNAGLLLAGQNDWAGAIDLYTQALRLDPRLASAYSNRGTAYVRAGRLDDALADLNKAVNLAPNAAGQRLQRSHVRMLRKEYDASLHDLDEALRRMPENVAVVRLHQGNVRLDMGQYDLAIAAFTEALVRGGHWPLARCNRSLAYLRQGDLCAALADCDEAIRLAPEEPIAYNNRGVVLAKLGDYGRAVLDLRTAQRLNPGHPNAYKNLAWLQATCPDSAFRDGADAVANATRAIQKVGASGGEWLEVLAAARAEAGDFTLAVRAQEEMLEHCPPGSRAEQQARLGLYRAGQPFRDYPRAITERDRAIRGEPDQTTNCSAGTRGGCES
jgi:Zn-dependent membrane protease YugP/Tfp pilus assembly protein PilF